MKKVLALFLLTVSFAATAHEPGFRYYGHPRYYHNPYAWVGPAIIGGVIGYEIHRHMDQPPPPPTVIIQQPPPAQPAEVPRYHTGTIYDDACRCYKQILIRD